MTSTNSRRARAGGSGARARQATLQPRAQATRQAILTAAAERFARYGYYATSLDSVLADSGGTKGALYFHFASKEALARAVISVMVQRWGELRVQVGSRGLDPLSTLLALADEVVIRLIENPIARGGIRLLNPRASTTASASGTPASCSSRLPAPACSGTGSNPHLSPGRSSR